MFVVVSMKTTVMDETNVVGIDSKRWHKLVVDAAPKRKQQTNERTKDVEDGLQ